MAAVTGIFRRVVSGIVQILETPLRMTRDGAAHVIDAAQFAAYDGRMFKHHKIYPIAAGATKRFLLVVPDGAVVFLSKVKLSTTGGPCAMRLYEDTTVSANGAAAGVYNADRESLNTPQAQLYTDPTVTSDGTQIEEHLIPTSKNEDGAGFLGEDYWKLPAGNYQLGISNDSTGTVNICAQIAWAE